MARLHDGVLKGLYVFESEGMRSVREEFFKWQGDRLLHGVGMRVEKSDTILFQTPETVEYKATFALNKDTCGF